MKVCAANFICELESLSRLSSSALLFKDSLSGQAGYCMKVTWTMEIKLDGLLEVLGLRLLTRTHVI